MLGRAGVIGLFSKKVNQKHKNYLCTIAYVFDTQVFLDSYLEKINGKEEDVLTYSDNPVVIWVFGGCTILVGLFLLWHILFNVDSTLFSSFHQGYNIIYDSYFTGKERGGNIWSLLE